MAVTFRPTAVKSGALIWRSIIVRPSIMFISIPAAASVSLPGIPLPLPVSRAYVWGQWRSTQRSSGIEFHFPQQNFSFQTGTHG